MMSGNAPESARAVAAVARWVRVRESPSRATRVGTPVLVTRSERNSWADHPAIAT